MHCKARSSASPSPLYPILCRSLSWCCVRVCLVPGWLLLQAAADATQALTDAGVAIDTDHFYTAGYGEQQLVGIIRRRCQMCCHTQTVAVYTEPPCVRAGSCAAGPSRGGGGLSCTGYSLLLVHLVCDSSRGTLTSLTPADAHSAIVMTDPCACRNTALPDAPAAKATGRLLPYPYTNSLLLLLLRACRLPLQAAQQAQRGVDHGSRGTLCGVSTARHSTPPAAAAAGQLGAAGAGQAGPGRPCGDGLSRSCRSTS